MVLRIGLSRSRASDPDHLSRKPHNHLDAASLLGEQKPFGPDTPNCSRCSCKLGIRVRVWVGGAASSYGVTMEKL